MNRNKLVVILLITVGVLALGLLIWAISRNPLASAKDAAGRIVYQSDQSGSKEIYMLDLASMDIIRLTNNSFDDYSPTYIQALNRIGFVSDREDGTNVFTMNLDGSDQQTVFSRSVLLDYPDWSPDGKLMTASYTDGCNDTNPSCEFDLYVIDPVTFALKQLTDTDGSEWVPQWSPDGQKIAFASDRDGDSEIYVIDANGSLAQLTHNNGYDGRPRWSPDGSQISFETDQDGGDWDVFIMNADGSKPHVVTRNDDSDDWMQFWSPDGEWLVFVSARDGDYELYIISVNGRNQQQLTSNDFADEAPVWIP